MLTDSVAVCLLDLDLESFVVELINDAGDVIPLLGQSDSEDRFTIFAINASALDEFDDPVNARGHIVNGTVDKKYLGYGNDVFRTLRENVFLHVVKGVETKVILIALCMSRSPSWFPLLPNKQIGHSTSAIGVESFYYCCMCRLSM